MNDVIITAIMDADSRDGESAETVSLAFAKIDVAYRPQKADGSLDAGIHFKYDLKANKEA
jgi:type VI secretion system secreted protein Hcp